MKIKEIKIINQDESTKIADIGANAENVDYNDTNVKLKLDELSNNTNINTINISNETIIRSNADRDLQNQINSLASGSPKGVYATVNDLISANPDTGVYIVTSNGHIYSWTKNETEAIDLGVYQASQDSTTTISNSINLNTLNSYFNIIYNGKNIQRNFDIPVDLKSGDQLIVNLKSLGNTYSLSLSKTYPYSGPNSINIKFNSTEDLENYFISVPGEYKCIHLFQNQTNNSGIDVLIQKSTFNLEMIKYLSKKLIDISKGITTSHAVDRLQYSIKKGDTLIINYNGYGHVTLRNTTTEKFQTLISTTSEEKIINNGIYIADDDFSEITFSNVNNTSPKIEIYIVNTNIFDYINNNNNTIYNYINKKSIVVTSNEKNKDFNFVVSKGSKIKIDFENNGENTINIVLSKTYPFNLFDNYVSLYNGSNSNGSLQHIATEDWNCLHLFNNLENNSELKVTISIINDLSKKKTYGKKIAIFGDSITSSYITNIGGLVNSILETNLISNFAHGNASCQDWQNEQGKNISPNHLNTINNSDTADNVLHNQILRLLQHTTAQGEQIKWNDNIGNEYSIDTSVGTGLGYTEDIPDIAYIAIGTNDGKPHNNFVNTPIIDDISDDTFKLYYNVLDRTKFSQSLRWAIDTLRFNYPNVQIFVATPLFTNFGYNDPSNQFNQAFSGKYEQIKRDIILKTCAFESVYVIDSQAESGYSRNIAMDNGQIHPNTTWANYIAKYIANEIENRYIER